MKLHLGNLCGGDVDRALLFEVFDWDRNSDPDLIGTCTTTVRELVDGATFPLINAKKKAKKGLIKWLCFYFKKKKHWKRN